MADARQKRFKIPPLSRDLYNAYPAMCAQAHEAAVKDYARAAVADLEAEVERLRASGNTARAEGARAVYASAYAEGAVAMREARVAHAERIGVRWAEDTDHTPTSRKVGLEIAALLRQLPIPPRATDKEG